MRWLDRKIIQKREYYIQKWISRYQNTKKILKGKIDMNIQCILNAKHVVRFPYDGSFTLHPEQNERMKRRYRQVFNWSTHTKKNIEQHREMREKNDSKHYKTLFLFWISILFIFVCKKSFEFELYSYAKSKFIFYIH